MSAPAKAVFISYASQDADAARRICETLRAAGIEVWFDQSDLRGGDVWDASIRRQIKNCFLFLPLISAQTQEREEGYFRREWNLAVARTLDMAEDRSFLLPVVIDGTPEAQARVPEKFREVQWTRLPNGVTSATFVARVQALTTGAAPAPVVAQSAAGAPADPSEDNTILKGTAPAAPSPVRPAAPRRTAAISPPATPRAGLWLAKFALPALLLAVAGYFYFSFQHGKAYARNELLPSLDAMAGKTFRGNARLFEMAVEAEKSLGSDPQLEKVWPLIATTLSIDTEPQGAEVLWKEYDNPAAPWNAAGVTPLKDVRVPRSFLRLEIRKAGYQTIEYATPGRTVGLGPTVASFTLDPVGTLPAGMVRVPAHQFAMALTGLEKYADQSTGEFLVDRYEVTNRDFKAFVDAGGYVKKEYWTVPIKDGAAIIPFERAVAKFTDRTGRPGPATWEAGTYADGLADHPVTGVSWYEAAAYAAFAKKQLPTLFQWASVADTARSEFIIPASNFSGKATSTVGSLPGMSTYGIYDLAGNAREWTTNATGTPGERFILGGGWNDASYAFNDSYAQPALDRSESNGFRCIREIPGKPTPAVQQAAITQAFRNYDRERPVDDASFAAYLRQFRYDKGPLEAKVEKTVEGDGWKLDIVTLDAGYNSERLQLNVYTPQNASAPFQPVIFFPGSNGLFSTTIDANTVRRLSFIMKSGRALIWPIYKGTYERRDNLKSDTVDESILYKDHIIAWGKELGRTLDYLETRKDMQAGKEAFLGWSWGGFTGGILPAVDKRIRVVVLNVGGMSMEQSLPEVDQINYLPRITQPVLMLNGKYDMYFPVESSQKPMFNFLGTPRKDKKIVIYDSGHSVPPTEFMKETLSWLDTYLGPATGEVKVH